MNIQKKLDSQLLPQHFFNESFYAEKVVVSSKTQKNQTFISYEFVKKYFEATRINELINKAFKITLQSPYLPQNPYGMIGRLLLHDSIFENIRAYYSMIYSGNSRKVLEEGNDPAQILTQKGEMKEFKIGGKMLMVGWKLSAVLRNDRVLTLWPLIFESRPKKIHRGSKTTDICYALGGSLILEICSPYSCEQSLTPYVIVTMNSSPNNDHINQFTQYIIQDCMRICQSPHNVFIKLYIYTYQPFSSEWASQNLIHNRIKIQKELVKVLMGGVEEIKVDYLIRVPIADVKVVGSMFVRVTKTYVLVQETANGVKVHSMRPATILLTSVFTSDSQYPKQVHRLLQTKGTPEEIINQLHLELHAGIIYALQQQQPTWLSWNLLYTVLYDFSEHRNKDKDLKSAISFLIDSPLGFIDQLRQQICIAKILCSKSMSIHQQEVLELIDKCWKKLKMYIHKQEHIYPETTIFFHAIQRNLSLILEPLKKTGPNKSQNIKQILSTIELLTRYLLNSFYQIVLVLKGHILNEIVKIDNQFGKDGSGEIISHTVTYDIFLRKYKDLPVRTLNINKQIKRIRPQIPKSDDEIREYILAKYVRKYQLYELVYEFYWGVICGKKLSYPMGQFVSILRGLAIRFQFQNFGFDENNGNKNKGKVEVTKTDGIVIYQKSADSRGDYLFYSFKESILSDEMIHIYRTIQQIFNDYLQPQIPSFKSSLSQKQEHARYSQILSICSNLSRLKSEDSDFNKCKIHIDIICNKPVTDIYKTMYTQILAKLQILQKNNFGIIGLYNGDKEFIDEDEVITWIEQDQRYDVNFVRYQAKKNINVESVVKLIKLCKDSGSEILIRGIFWLNGLLKSCQISVNFYMNEKWIFNHVSMYQERIFSKHEDIAKWMAYTELKVHIAQTKSLNPKNEPQLSTVQKYLTNRIDLIQFVAQDLDKPLQIQKVRTFSPFYCQLEQSMYLVEGLFYMLQYVKVDKSGKFQVKDYCNTVQILQYYLFDNCLRMDRYIYSEGLSVTIINLVGRIHRYIETHMDNNGQQKQLVFLQKVTIKLMNCIRYALTSCAFGVIEALKQNYIDQQAKETGEQQNHQGQQNLEGLGSDKTVR